MQLTSQHLTQPDAYRIPWGATQANEYLLKLIQLKYPTFPTRVVPVQTNVTTAFF